MVVKVITKDEHFFSSFFTGNFNPGEFLSASVWLLFLKVVKSVLRINSFSRFLILATSSLMSSRSYHPAISRETKMLLMFVNDIAYRKFCCIKCGTKKLRGTYCCDSIGRPRTVSLLENFGPLSSSRISELSISISASSSLDFISSCVRQIGATKITVS